MGRSKQSMENLKVTRCVNGVEVSEEEFYKMRVSNPIIDRICRGVVRRVKQQSVRTESGGKESAGKTESCDEKTDI